MALESKRGPATLRLKVWRIELSFSRSDSMPARHYYNRRQRNPGGRNATLELVVTVVVMALVVVVVLVFLFVYHDFPFRIGGP